MEQLQKHHPCTTYTKTCGVNKRVEHTMLIKQRDETAGTYPQHKIDMTALMMASMNGHRDTVQILLEKGANIDSSDRSGNTALIWASRNNCKEIGN